MSKPVETKPAVAMPAIIKPAEAVKKPFDPLKAVVDDLKAENLGIKDLERNVMLSPSAGE